MSKFALQNIDRIKGQIRFKKLIVDGECQFDQFCELIRHEGNLEKQLIGIFNKMEEVAQMRRLPREKFRDITPAKESIKEFEIKKGDLRVYVIKEDGHIVVLGGKKGDQDEDIKQLRSIKRRYVDSKKK